MVRRIIYNRPFLATKVRQLVRSSDTEAFRELNAECSRLHWLQIFCSSFHHKVGFTTLHLESRLALWFALNNAIWWMWRCSSWDETSEGLASSTLASYSAIVKWKMWSSHLEDDRSYGEREVELVQPVQLRPQTYKWTHPTLPIHRLMSIISNKQNYTGSKLKV